MWSKMQQARAETGTPRSTADADIQPMPGNARFTRRTQAAHGLGMKRSTPGIPRRELLLGRLFIDVREHIMAPSLARHSVPKPKAAGDSIQLLELGIVQICT